MLQQSASCTAKHSTVPLQSARALLVSTVCPVCLLQHDMPAVSQSLLMPMDVYSWTGQAGCPSSHREGRAESRKRCGPTQRYMEGK